VQATATGTDTFQLSLSIARFSGLEIVILDLLSQDTTDVGGLQTSAASWVCLIYRTVGYATGKTVGWYARNIYIYIYINLNLNLNANFASMLTKRLQPLTPYRRYRGFAPGPHWGRPRPPAMSPNRGDRSMPMRFKNRLHGERLRELAEGDRRERVLLSVGLHYSAHSQRWVGLYTAKISELMHIIEQVTVDCKGRIFSRWHIHRLGQNFCFLRVDSTQHADTWQQVSEVAMWIGIAALGLSAS